MTGYAILACTAKADGKLDDCTLDEEAPFGFGFDQAGLLMAKDGAVEVAPGAPGPTLVRIEFHRGK